MRPSDENRLIHILDAGREAVELTRGISAEELSHDRLRTLAVWHLIEIIGEAARHVSTPCRKRIPLPWQEMIDTRNRLTHGYFDVDGRDPLVDLRARSSRRHPDAGRRNRHLSPDLSGRFSS
jgi:uncharacterized protein with HEPN domain